MTILTYKEWQSLSGRWYCNDTTKLPKWWVPARMLNISVEEYIILLYKTFHARIDKYIPETDELIFSWDNQKDCHNFVLYINKQAKQKNFLI